MRKKEKQFSEPRHTFVIASVFHRLSIMITVSEQSGPSYIIYPQSQTRKAVLVLSRDQAQPDKLTTSTESSQSFPAKKN